MPSKIIRKPEHVDALAEILRGRKLPLTVTWSAGAPRTDAQNALSFKWYGEIAEQLGDTYTEEVRATCKLRFGVPILRRDDPKFQETYDQCLKPLPYEVKVKFIQRMELPITRIMKTPQMSEYLDRIQQEYLPLGIRLTDPEALKYEMEFVK